jgi:protein-ribulosamine 3-kinase
VLVAKLRAQSNGTSLQFATSIPLFDGILNYWESTRPRFFAKVPSQLYYYNCLTNGVWDNLHAATIPVIQIVVPRLLNELEKGDRKIEPPFIHGDLWNVNFGLDDSTGKLYLFHSSGYYAHHEMEFSYWRTLHHRMCKQNY